MRNSFFEVFRIDALGKRIFIRLLFLFLVAVNLFVIFYQPGDSNFDAYITWMNNVIENNLYDQITTLDSLPLTRGNYIFMFSVLGMVYLDVAASWLYTALFIRNYRLRKNPDKAISISKLIFRFISICVLSAFLLSIFSVFVLYLFIIFIIIFPYFVMFPACYLSGDRSFFGSFKGMFEVTKGYYLTNVRNLSLMLCFYFLSELVLDILSKISAATRAAMVPFVIIFFLLSLGRYVGIIYIRMLHIPGGLTIVVNTRMNKAEDMNNSDNDVQTPEE